MEEIHPKIKKLLGFNEDEDDVEILDRCIAASSVVCKPCWELKYCPYGPLVEDSPLLPLTLEEAREHNEDLKAWLAQDDASEGDDGQALEPWRRDMFEKEVAEFNESDYPASIPAEIAEMQCTVFGHICPVVFSAEGFTETSESRRYGRYIPMKVKMRVARRDNYTCQVCSKNLRDDEIEFDHIIPVSRGGSSEEHNLRLTCFDCNRSKGIDVEI